MTRRPILTAAAMALVLAVSGLGWWLLRSDQGSAPAAAPPAVTSTVGAPAVSPARDECRRTATRPFTPHRIAIENVVDRAEVVGVARDSRGVTGVLPISNRTDVAWDLGGIRPGSRRGNVLLNTHAWPDGSALGNALLEGLGAGDRIVLHGSNGARSCYQVDRRVEVLASQGYPPYYQTQGPPQVAIIVCSGTRSSDGEWSHRTIWFAGVVGRVGGAG